MWTPALARNKKRGKKMTTTELLQLIRRKYRLVNNPSKEELQEVAKQLLELSCEVTGFYSKSPVVPSV